MEDTVAVGEEKESRECVTCSVICLFQAHTTHQYHNSIM